MNQKGLSTGLGMVLDGEKGLPMPLCWFFRVMVLFPTRCGHSTVTVTDISLSLTSTRCSPQPSAVPEERS